MKKDYRWYNFMLLPFLMIAALVLFVLDNFNIDVTQAVSYVKKDGE